MTAERIKSNRSSIAVVGLDDFRRQIARVLQDGGPDGKQLLKDANWKVAQYVVENAQARAATVGRMQVRAAQNLKASKTMSASMIIGTEDNRVPYFFGAEFGAKRDVLRKERKAAGWAGPGRWRGYRQFLPWRGNRGAVGYFLFPTMRDKGPQIKDMYADQLDDIAKRIFPEES